MALSDRGAVILLAVLFVAQYSGASASFNPGERRQAMCALALEINIEESNGQLLNRAKRLESWLRGPKAYRVSHAIHPGRLA